MLRPETFFARTALAMAIALLAFVVLTGFLVFHYILSPVAHQAADDLAALMVLSAQTWAELPPETRPDFVEELKRNHRLLLQEQPPGNDILPPASYQPLPGSRHGRLVLDAHPGCGQGTAPRFFP